MTDPHLQPDKPNDSLPRRRFGSLPGVPLSFWTIIILCVAVFAYGLTSPENDRWLLLHGALWPQLFHHSLLPVFEAQPYTMFLTYGFLHGGPLHLAMNMFALYALARSLAAAVPGLVMIAVYFVSQLVAGWVQLLMSDSELPVVGASGAIFGLAGAELAIAAVLILRKRGNLRPLAGPFLQFVILNVALTLAVPNIAWQAHVGGAIAGVVLGALWAVLRMPHRPI